MESKLTNNVNLRNNAHIYSKMRRELGFLKTLCTWKKGKEIRGYLGRRVKSVKRNPKVVGITILTAILYFLNYCEFG